MNESTEGEHIARGPREPLGSAPAEDALAPRPQPKRGDWFLFPLKDTGETIEGRYVSASPSMSGTATYVMATEHHGRLEVHAEHCTPMGTASPGWQTPAFTGGDGET
jgi:hypothetical protein